MEQYVLDASVAVKLVFKEVLSDNANQFVEPLRLKKIQIIVPELFYFELANVCWGKAKKGLFPPGHTMEALDKILGLPLTIYYSDREFADVALENALRFGISAYDGAYLALAEIYLAPLVTADEKLLAACRGKFDFIESLAEIKLPA